jgi:hypothetical protein
MTSTKSLLPWEEQTHRDQNTDIFEEAIILFFTILKQSWSTHIKRSKIDCVDLRIDNIHL